MNVKSRTIDNLGVDASRQYAENLKYIDAQLDQKSKLISRKAEIPSVKPYVASEHERFFNVGKAASWALFSPPPDFFIYGENLFSYMMIPSLGTQEEQEADLQKIEHLKDYLAKDREKKRGKKRERESEEEGEEERQKQTLVAMFQVLGKLDKVLTLINSRRNQYQRG